MRAAIDEIERLGGSADGMPVANEIRVKSVRFDKGNADDRATADFDLFPDLESLRLKGTGVTDAGTARVRGLQKLAGVELCACQISDKGIADSRVAAGAFLSLVEQRSRFGRRDEELKRRESPQVPDIVQHRRYRCRTRGTQELAESGMAPSRRQRDGSGVRRMVGQADGTGLPNTLACISSPTGRSQAKASPSSKTSRP